MSIQQIDTSPEYQLVALQTEINQLKAALEEQNQKVNAAMALYIQEQGQNERLNEILRMNNRELKPGIEELIRANEAIVKENKLIKDENALLKSAQIDKNQLHAAEINTLKNKNAKLSEINQNQKSEIVELKNKEDALINVYLFCKDEIDVINTYGARTRKSKIMQYTLNTHGNMSQAVAAVDPYYPGLWTRKWS